MSNTEIINRAAIFCITLTFTKVFLSVESNYNLGDFMDYVEKKIEHLETEIKELKKFVKSSKKARLV